MSTFVGRREVAAIAKAAEPKLAAKKGKKPTKTELMEEAEALGIEVPEGATNSQIQKLIDEAPVM